MAKKIIRKTNAKAQAAAKAAAKAKRDAKAAAKAQAAAKAAKPVVAVTIRHNTNRYADDGHPKDSLATRTVQKRYDVASAVASGKATIGSIESEFGFSGLRVVARHIRFGRYDVRGAEIESAGKLDPAADLKLANKLAAGSKTVKITFKNKPVELCRR